jgi:hypothetical protein
VGCEVKTVNPGEAPTPPALLDGNLDIPAFRRDLLPATLATDTDESAEPTGTDEPDQNVVHVGEVSPDDLLIREGEAAAAEYTRSVEASAISREQIVGEFFAGADVADIFARLPQAKLDQIREQAVDSWFGDLDLDAVLDRIPDARWSELLDLCISACTTVETLVVPVKTPRKLLGDLNGTLRWTLDQEDVSNAAQGVKIIRAKLAANKRDAKALRLVFVKGK